MKKLLVLAIMITLGFTAQAQHETLFGRARVVGAFGAPIVEIGLQDDFANSIGGGGGLVIGEFFVGGYGIGSVDLSKLIEEEDIDGLEIAHGGIWMGFTYKAQSVIHLFASTKIGWGALDINFDDPFDPFDHHTDKIFVFSPEAGIEINITRWLRVAGTVGYRWLDGANPSYGYTNDDFEGAMSTITFRIGGFGNYRY